MFAAETKLDASVSVLELSQSKMNDLLPKPKTPLPPLKVVRLPTGSVVQGAVEEKLTTQGNDHVMYCHTLYLSIITDYDK